MISSYALLSRYVMTDGKIDPGAGPEAVKAYEAAKAEGAAYGYGSAWIMDHAASLLDQATTTPAGTVTTSGNAGPSIAASLQPLNPTNADGGISHGGGTLGNLTFGGGGSLTISGPAVDTSHDYNAGPAVPAGGVVDTFNPVAWLDEKTKGRPDLVNNWNNATSDAGLNSNAPLLVSIRRYKTFNDYVVGNYLDTADAENAEKVYYYLHPDVLANWTNATDPSLTPDKPGYVTGQNILKFGSLGAYAKAAAKASYGAPAASNQTGTGTVSAGASAGVNNVESPTHIGTDVPGNTGTGVTAQPQPVTVPINANQTLEYGKLAVPLIAAVLAFMK